MDMLQNMIRLDFTVRLSLALFDSNEKHEIELDTMLRSIISDNDDLPMMIYLKQDLPKSAYNLTILIKSVFNKHHNHDYSKLLFLMFI